MGLVTHLALNGDGSQIAVSYDYTTKIFPLPFPGELSFGHYVYIPGTRP